MRTSVPAFLSSQIASHFESSPLRHQQFRMFYYGTIAAALGYMMQTTIAAWVMATLTPSVLMVALVQTASTTPSLIVGLVAGTMADLVDRRKLITINMIVLTVATLILGAATLAGIITPVLLLVLTFIVGASFTFYMPAQSASVNELVAREELPRAIALGAVAYNVARAIGPALAGMIAAATGSGAALMVSAAFFALMIVAVRSWKSHERPLPGVPETLLSGVMSGVRYMRHSIAMRTLIIRSLMFTICASALWALLPVVARDQLHLGAGGFGSLFAGFGVGAVVGALAIPGQLKVKSLNSVVTSGVILWVVATLLVAATEYTALALLGTACAGMAWVAVHASLSAGLQSTAPAWVRARAVAIGLISVQASMALGSVLWGMLAAALDTHVALAASAGVLIVLHLFNRGIEVRMGEDADVTPGVQLPTLTIADEPEPDDGPVLIQIEYRIEREQRADFLRVIQKVEPTRRRNGATSWRVFRDLAEEGRFVERYVLASWGEYVRLRNRMTVADRKYQERVEAYQKPGVPIRVSRLIGINARDANLADAGTAPV
ncbi:MAG: MFS transporter [Burkholderiales bacterium]|nr:MFS transporter [Burkholderiales bacterium]